MTCPSPYLRKLVMFDRIGLPLSERHLCGFAALALSAVTLADCSRSSAPPLLTTVSARDASSLGLPSQRYKVLFSFGSNVYGRDGAYPVAGVIEAEGMLYGTTQSGGSYGIGRSGIGGTVFRVTASGVETVLHSFSGRPDGAGPVAGVIAVKGTLFGTTAAGGKYNGGAVFSINESGQHERMVHSFGNGADGANPRGNLILVNGKLYGTTYQGGTYGAGTVFSVRIRDGQERVLHSFSNSPDGAYPLAGLLDVKDDLYGTTVFGGLHDGGAVFRITKAGVEAVLYSFNNPPDGNSPMAGLVRFNGTLYGTTAEGGAYGQAGTVYSLSTSGQEHVLHSFGSHGDGSQPQAALIPMNSQFYGTTYTGGAAGYGTIFRISQSGKERVLHSFGDGYENDGMYPESGLTNVSGTLYSTTNEGGISLPSCPYSGACAWGTVFGVGP